MTLVFKFLSLLSLVFSLISLIAIFAVFSIVSSGTETKAADVLNLMGAIVTGISFMIGCYFAFRAIQGYGQIRDIENRLKEAKNIEDHLREELNKAAETRNEIGSSMIETINSMHETAVELVQSLLSQTSNDDDKRKMLDKIHNKISRQRGTLFFLKQLPNDTREKALMYLIRFGDEFDREKLQKIITDPTESENIKNSAKKAYEIIQQRFKHESSNSPP